MPSAAALAKSFARYRAASLLPVDMALRGPVGEDNRLSFMPRGTVLGVADGVFDALRQFGAALATGNRFLLAEGPGVSGLCERMPAAVRSHIATAAAWREAQFDAVLASSGEAIREIALCMAARPGRIIPVVPGAPDYDLHMLVKEKTVSINTTAAGGNASLLTLVK